MKKLILSTTVVLCLIAASNAYKPDTPSNVTNASKPTTKSNYAQVARFIKAKESLRLQPYKCSAGKLTIGYGHVIKRGEHFTRITKHQADSIFVADFNKAYNEVRSLGIKNPDTARVLSSFNFNCGIGATRKVVLSHKYDNLKKYVYANGKRLKGLVIRRNQEYAMLGVVQ